MDSKSQKRQQTISGTAAASPKGQSGRLDQHLSEMKAVSAETHLKQGAHWFNVFHGTGRENLSTLLQHGLHPHFGGGTTTPRLDMMQQHLLDQSKELGKRMKAAKLGEDAKTPANYMSDEAYEKAATATGAVSPQFFLNSVGKVHFSKTPKEATGWASGDKRVMVAARIPPSWQSQPDPDLPGAFTLRKAIPPSHLYVLAGQGWIPLHHFVGREKAYGGNPTLKQEEDPK